MIDMETWKKNTVVLVQLPPLNSTEKTSPKVDVIWKKEYENPDRSVCPLENFIAHENE